MDATHPADPALDEMTNPLRLRGHTPVLDGLRGLAILLVLLLHITPSGPSTTRLGAVTKALADVGPVGVDLFFVLSGFLITGILLDTKGSPRYFRTFYARRALRIFPLYYGVLFVSFVLVPVVWTARSPDAQRIYRDQDWLWFYASNIKGSLTTMEKPFTAGGLQFDHFWSLAVEEQFYLVWPVLILIFSRRMMIGLCVFFMAGALALRWWLFHKGDETAAFYSLTPCRIDELAMGGLLALLARKPLNKALLKAIALFAFSISGVTLAAIWNTDARAMVIGTTLLAFFFGALIVLLLMAGPRNPLRRTFALYPMRLVGKFSYAIYVLHPFLLVLLAKFISYQRLGELTHSGGLGVFLYMLIAFGVTFTAGWLSWHLYEKHFLKLKRFVEYAPRRSCEA